MGHMSAPEATTEAGAVRSRRTRVSGESLLISEAEFGTKGHVTALDLSWMTRGVRSLWARDNVRALLGVGKVSRILNT
jgi:hypothetical protein